MMVACGLPRPAVVGACLCAGWDIDDVVVDGANCGIGTCPALGCVLSMKGKIACLNDKCRA